MHSALLPFQEQTNHLIKSRPKLQIQTKSIAAEVWEGALQCHRESPWRLAGRGHHVHLIIIVVDQPNYHQLFMVIAIARLSWTTTSVYMIK